VNTAAYIAKRYLLAKKSHNIIHIISWISVVGIAMSTMALFIVLSVFNGFGDLILSLYNSFDPDIQITAREGKTFPLDQLPLDKISTTKGVAHYTPVLEENAILKYDERQYIATLKGVTKNFALTSGIDTLVTEGKTLSQSPPNDFAIFGWGVAYHLDVHLNSYQNPLSIYIPKRENVSTAIPLNAFNSGYVIPSGVFAVQQDFDSKYILVPLSLMQELTDKAGQISALEIALLPDADLEDTQNKLQEICGYNYSIKTRMQLHDFLYKILRYEKSAVYLILSFIMLLAVFNVIGSLSMLILEKKKDTAILRSMGADNQLIKRIFYLEGMMISFFGASVGLFLGLLFCWIQQTTGFIKLGGNSAMLLDAFPVKIMWTDFIGVYTTVLLMGAMAVWFPVRKISKAYLSNFRDLSVR